MDEEKQREVLQNLAMEADAHQRRAQEIQNQMQSLQMAEAEIEKTNEALKNLRNGEIALFSVGSGIFVNGELKNVDKLLINIGSNAMIEMNIEGALKFTENRKKEIEDAKDGLMKGMQMISERLKEIDKEARILIESSEHHHEHEGAGGMGHV